LQDLGAKLNPIVKYWDPLDLVSSSPWGFTEEQTIGWLRQSEIKHSRVSMAAFVGYCVQSNFRFPWPMTLDGTPFPSTDLSPPEQWDALPFESKIQIIIFIGFLEFFSELNIDGKNAHYTMGGDPGVFPELKGNLPHPVPFNLYDPFGLSSKMSAEQKERRLRSEINNGRLAMLGIFGFLCEQTIPGSVPGLSAIVSPYSGEVMAPFEGNLNLF
jgi:Chlorophyll A-B binding protein